MEMIFSKKLLALRTPELSPYECLIPVGMNVGEIRTGKNVSETVISTCLRTLHQWQECALAGKHETMHELFAEDSSFSGTMASRSVQVNTEAEPEDMLGKYMTKFLPELTAITWKKIIVTEPFKGQGYIATGTYVFTKKISEEGQEQSKNVSGRFTYVIDAKGLIHNHTSGVLIEGQGCIEL